MFRVRFLFVYVIGIFGWLAAGPGGVSAMTPLAASNPALSAPAFWSFAPMPVMGWNSWDCFGVGVTEAQVLENADYMEKNLKSHGYTLVTIDAQWFEPKAHGSNYRPDAVLEMDGYGRLLPAANRFPLTNETHSFKPLADVLHARGLKFGLHLMRGIPQQAVAQNMPILGTAFHAGDIADKADICQWNGDMYGVDMSKPGAQEYYDSVLQLMASWEIDFIKVDDLSRPYHQAEIEAIRKAIDKTGRTIVLSTSPGETPVAQGPHIEMNANMWRVSDDFWDQWRLLKEQFARLDNWTPFRGAGHFPDADMLPVGNIRTFQTRDTQTRFNHDELTTMMTLWAMARSPLILGGNLPKNDEFTLQLITNDEVLAVDQHSANNRQLRRDGDLIVWTADEPGTLNKYVAFFNASELPRQPAPPEPGHAAPMFRIAPKRETMTVTAHELGYTMEKITGVRDLWNHKDVDMKDEGITVDLLPHCCAMFKVSAGKL